MEETAVAGLFATLDGVAGGAVEVAAGDVAEHLAGATAVGPTFEVAPGRFLLRLPNGLRFLVVDGAHVTYHQPPGLVSGDVALFLMGSVWAALAYQRGLLPLHMSGIVRDGAVVGFSGPSGAGKSTLAAALVQRGHPLFTDDTAAVDLSTPEEVRCVAAPARLKLWGDALELVGLAGEEPVRSDASIDKHFVTPPVLAPGGSTPLRRLYVLLDRSGQPEGAPDLEIARRVGVEAVRDLLGCVHRPRFAQQILGRERLYVLLGRVAAGVEVHRFDRPTEPAAFATSTDRIEAHLGAP